MANNIRAIEDIGMECPTEDSPTTVAADVASVATQSSVTYHAYCRRNGGDYFQVEFCPFDGWSSPQSRELTRTVARLVEQGIALSFEALVAAGVSAATLQQTIVIAFASSDAAFDAISPRECVVGGEARPPHISRR
jgi:hypothetical protein